MLKHITMHVQCLENMSLILLPENLEYIFTCSWCLLVSNEQMLVCILSSQLSNFERNNTVYDLYSYTNISAQLTMMNQDLQ